MTDVTDMIGNKNEAAAAGLEAVIEAAIVAAAGLAPNTSTNIGEMPRAEAAAPSSAYAPKPSGSDFKPE